VAGELSAPRNLPYGNLPSRDPDGGTAAAKGRFTADNWVVDQFVKIANRPQLLAVATVVDLVGCGVAYAVIESHDVIKGLWWAVVTGFTVGYGDTFPETTAGRGLGAFLIISMFVLALCLGAQITSRLIVDHDEFTHAEQLRMEEKMDRILANQARILTALRLDPAGPDPDGTAGAAPLADPDSGR
jgi:hypothetical protein